MELKEYLNYIAGYVNACKIKNDNIVGGAFVYCSEGTLICCDSNMSTFYLINLEYHYPVLICNRIDRLIAKDNSSFEPVIFDLHIFNIINNTMMNLLNPNLKFEYIEFSNNKYFQEGPIPTRSTDNANRNIYYYSDDPSKNIVQYDFYNMIPLNKDDKYTVSIAKDEFGEVRNTSIVRYEVYKKKPKCTILVYRRILNL